MGPAGHIAAEVLFRQLRRDFETGRGAIKPLHRDGNRIFVEVGEKRYNIIVEDPTWLTSQKS